MSFYCHECDRVCPDVLCDRCFTILSDDCREIEAGLEPFPVPDEPIICAVVNQHWGDVMGVLCNVKAALDGRGQDRCDVLYWGPHQSICEFIEAQPFVRKVLYSGETYNYMSFAYSVWLRSFPRDECRKMLPDVPGFDKATAYIDSFSTCVQDRQYKLQPYKFVVPSVVINWCAQFLAENIEGCWGDVVLLHPWSTWSVDDAGHYPFTREAIDWLLEATPYTYLLTGLNEVDIVHPRLINAVGKMPSNMHNFALTRLLGRTVSTSNSVSIYCACHGLPALVFSTDPVSKTPWNIYRRLIDREPIEFVHMDASLEDFKSAARRFFSA